MSKRNGVGRLVFVGAVVVCFVSVDVGTSFGQWNIDSCLVSSTGPQHELIGTFDCEAYKPYKVEIYENNATPSREWRWSMGQSGHPTGVDVEWRVNRTDISIWDNATYLSAQCEAELYKGSVPPGTWTFKDDHTFNW